MITQVTTCYCSSRARWGFSLHFSVRLPLSPLSLSLSIPVCLSSSNTCSSPSLWPNFPLAVKVTHTCVVDLKVGVRCRDHARKNTHAHTHTQKYIINKSEHLHGNHSAANWLQGKQRGRKKLTLHALLPRQLCCSSSQSYQGWTLLPLSPVLYFNPILCLFYSPALLWPSPSHSTLLLEEKQLEESPSFLSPCPVPPSVSLDMVLMRCWTFILTVRSARRIVSVWHRVMWAY